MAIKAIYESSITKGTAHISCIKYRNLNNISHYHNDYELVYIHEGCATVSINENIYNLNAKDCIFIHSNDIHFIQSNETTVISVLKAEHEHFKGILGSRKLLSPIVNERLHAQTFFTDVYSELHAHMEHSDIMADSLASLFFITLLRSEPTSSCENASSKKLHAPQLYQQILAKISNEYDTITFAEAAKYMNLSEPYFSKVFHKLFGMTFTQYLNTVRIAAAIKKLKTGNVSVTEVSASCGFNTIRNFNRVFKHFTGYTPGNLPSEYVFLYNLQEDCGLNPTLNCSEILE